MVRKQLYSRLWVVVVALLSMCLLLTTCNREQKEKVLKNYIMVGYFHGDIEPEQLMSQMNIYETIYLSDKKTKKDTIVIDKKTFKEFTKTLDGFEPSYKDVRRMDYEMFVVYNGKIYFIDRLGHVFNSDANHINSNDRFIYKLMVRSLYYNWWGAFYIKFAPLVEKYGIPYNYNPITEKEIKINKKISLCISYKEYSWRYRYSLVYLTEED